MINMSWEDILKEEEYYLSISDKAETKKELESMKKDIERRTDIVLKYLDQYQDKDLKKLKGAMDSLHNAIVEFDIQIFTLHEQSHIDITDDLPINR